MEDDHGVIGQRTFRESEINSTHSRHGQLSSSRGGKRRFLVKENLYQRRNLMVWFWIFASLTLSSFWPHNGQECEVWQNLVDSFLNLLGLLLLSQGWTYLKLLYELSTETKLGSLEWAPKRLLPNISLSYLYFSTILYTFLFCLYFSTFVFLYVYTFLL